ncbi:MAG TPA: DUF2189 domain-containing protein [Stellaceae bacterium]|nr:DUF2189 domain-containing protein [Stellaceae bacterium]
MAIRNPIEWSVDQFRLAAVAAGSVGRAGHRVAAPATPPRVRHIAAADLVEAVQRGLDDFMAYRSDVIFLCLIYPVVGLVLARLASGYAMLPLIFPLASGFALIGPLAAIGLYEMSRRREAGAPIGWPDAFGVVGSRSFGAIVALGVLLIAIFALWLVAAALIYRATLGPAPPSGVVPFLHDVFATPQGWAMIGIGIGVGFLFACLVLAISVVSFPLLLDRDVGFAAAIATSLRVTAANPGPIALWGLIVAVGLVVGSIPLLFGLVFVMPILGHASWHLYRRAVAR